MKAANSVLINVPRNCTPNVTLAATQVVTTERETGAGSPVREDMAGDKIHLTDAVTFSRVTICEKHL